MKAISKLKDDARRYEQREEWEKAVEAYLQVLHVGEAEEAEVELPLFNRIGDLYVRLGRPEDAVTYYEQAADRYADAGLYNNAIALCNKALRYKPSRLPLLRKLGQFSASQGFLVDARRYFLEYAERQFSAGAVNEALNALESFADVVDDPEIREMLGRQLHAHGRSEEAVAELRKAHAAFLDAGEADRAERVRAEIQSIDPAAAAAGPPVDAGAAWDAPAAGLEARDAVADDGTTAADAVPEWAGGEEPPAADDHGLADFEFQTAGEPDWPEEPPTTVGPTLEGFEATHLGGEDEGAAAGLPGLEAPAADDESEEGDVAGFGTLDGLESTSLDFGAAAADLDAMELGFELERDETSFDGPGLADPGGGLEGGSLELPAPDDAGAEFTGSSFDLPSLDDPYAEQADDDRPALDEPEEDTGFELPFLEDFGGEAGDAVERPAAGDLAEEDAAAVDLTGPDGEDTWQAETGFDLPGLDDVDFGEAGAPAGPDAGTEADGPVDALPGLDDSAPSLSDWSVEEIPGHHPAHEPEAEPTALESDDADRADVAEVPDLADVGDASVVDVPAETAWAAAAEAELSAGWTPDDALAGAGAAEAEPEGPAAAASEEPPAAAEGYIDLGALLKDDEPRTTRFRVHEATPTGDEDRDFAELLSQFKAKVSEHLPPEDAAAHYDLGIAFKEMGLIDEAISEFQIALRAGNMRLRVYEELGDCFLQKQQYNIAEKVLRRGLEMPYDDELELLGVYYHLGRAYEGLGRREQARDAYERVLGLDINFQDVSERLSRL